MTVKLYTDHAAVCHSFWTNECPPPPSRPLFYRPDALTATQPTLLKHWRQLSDTHQQTWDRKNHWATNTDQTSEPQVLDIFVMSILQHLHHQTIKKHGFHQTLLLTGDPVVVEVGSGGLSTSCNWFQRQLQLPAMIIIPQPKLLETAHRCEWVSEWVSSFLTAHQHTIGYSVPQMVDSKRTRT